MDAIPIPNNCALSSIAYDRYLTPMLDHVGDNCMSLDQFVAQTALVYLSKRKGQLNGFQLFPWEGERALMIAADSGKKVVRTLLKALWDAERRNVCLDVFGWDNIIVTRSGRAKFTNLLVRENLEEEELIAGLQNNYISAQTIIKRMYGNLVPDDIGELIHLIGTSFERRALFHVHASLIPLAKSPNLFKEMYDYCFSVLPKPDLWDLLDDMMTSLRSIVIRWRAMISSNPLLEACRGFNGGRSYVIPVNKAGQTNLYGDQIINLRLIGMDPAGKKTLTTVDLDRIQAMQLLMFMRNRHAHRMEPHGAFILANAGQRYNGEGSERVSHARFSRVLTFLQSWLHSKGRLGDIQLHELF